MRRQKQFAICEREAEALQGIDANQDSSLLDREQQYLDGHLFEEVLAFGAHASGRLAVCDAAADAAALLRSQIWRVRVSGVDNWPAHLALLPWLQSKTF